MRKRTHKVPVKAQQSESSTSAPLYHRNGRDMMQEPATVSETASYPRMNAACRDIHLQGRGLSEKLVTLGHYRNYRSSFPSASVATSDHVLFPANSVTPPIHISHQFLKSPSAVSISLNKTTSSYLATSSPSAGYSGNAAFWFRGRG